MPIVAANGIDLYYIEAGSGEPLVLVMGFGGDHSSWGFQLSALSAQYRVIAFDNRGSGRSSAPDLPYTTRMMADDAIALMDRLGIERAHILGASLGEITCPTLVAVGEEDQLAPPRFSREIARAIAHAEFRTIPEAGHVYFWEKPADFNALCLSFLSKHRGV